MTSPDGTGTAPAADPPRLPDPPTLPPPEQPQSPRWQTTSATPVAVPSALLIARYSDGTVIPVVALLTQTIDGRARTVPGILLRGEIRPADARIGLETIDYAADTNLMRSRAGIHNTDGGLL